MSKHRVKLPHWGWWLSIGSGLTLLSVLTLSSVAYAWWTSHVTTIFTPLVLQGLFAFAWLAHVMEAAYAYRLCRAHGIPEWGWSVQTFVVGFPSLLLLLEETRNLSNE